jgi:hypothetical protein
MNSSTVYFTTDTTNPTITIESPQNITYNVNSVNLSYTVADNIAVDTCWLYIDSIGPIGLPGCFNATIVGFPDGSHNVTMFVNDTANNRNSSTVYFTVDTTPPAVNLVSPANNSIFNTSSVDFTFNATDNISTTLNCSLYLDGVLNQTNSSTQNGTDTTFSVTGIPDGLHNWSVSCKDGVNNTGTSQTWFFTVDTTNPTITIQSPTNTTYGVDTVDLNYTVADNIGVDSCWYTLDGGAATPLASCTNSSLGPLADGNHNVTVYVNDTANNMNSSTVYFTIDTTEPVVTHVAPPNGSFFNVPSVNVTFNATDNLDPVLNCSLYLDGVLNQTNSSTQNGTDTTFGLTGLADGTYAWNVSCLDDALNEGFEAPWFFTIDTVPPGVTIQSPTNSTYNTSSVDLNYTATDPNLESCWYVLDGGAATPLANCTNTSIGPMADGPHNVTVYANDSAGNSNSSTVFFTTDTTPPTVTIQSPTNTTYNVSTIDLNYTALDNLAIDSCWYYLDGSGPIALPGCLNSSLSGLANGPHNVTVFANDTAGNMNSSTEFFTVYVPPGDDDDDDEKKRMSVDYEFICPGDKVLFNATKAGGDPLSGVSIKVIYKEPPFFGTVGTVTTDATGTADITLTQNGTYKLKATRSGYHMVEKTFEFTTCPSEYECIVDEDCEPLDECTEEYRCEPVECECGYVSDHQCIEYECCDDEDCPEGQDCIDNICRDECYEDDDCKSTEYCDIQEGADGGSCEDVTGDCGYAENHVWVTYECGDEPGCPACPEDGYCEDYVCVYRNLTCPESGLLGSEQTCHVTENNVSCSFCDLRIIKPDGTVLPGQTDGNGNFRLFLDQIGTYNVSLMVGGAAIKSIGVFAFGKEPIIEEPEAMFTLEDACLPLLLILLLLILLFFWWRRRKKLYATLVTKAAVLGAPVDILVKDRRSNKPVGKVAVTVFHGGKQLKSGLTNKVGKYSFTPTVKGIYKVHILGREKPETVVKV